MPANRNGGYSAAEFSSMQRDAVNRVLEMQRRAQMRLEQSNRMASAGQMPAPTSVPQHSPQHISQPQPQIPQPAFPFQGILEKLGMDGETAVLLILLLILLNEGADRSLILALVYVLVG